MNEHGEPRRDVLKGVSRSFYLSLRLLPTPMRKPAGIAYLLARTSDTIADSAAIPAAQRMAFLELHERQVSGLAESISWPRSLIDATPDPREKRLLENHTRILGALRETGSVSLDLIREVIATIISGQKLDLERFGNASAQNIIALPDVAALDDYTWRVAGCVGVFWTKLGFATLGDGFSKASCDELLELASFYGRGLQLVNILRDLPSDMRAGRCYLPVSDPLDDANLMLAFHAWRKLALRRIHYGMEYSKTLCSKRLRIASSLPAFIGRETLESLENATYSDLERGIRIPRRRVYSLLLASFLRG